MSQELELKQNTTWPSDEKTLLVAVKPNDSIFSFAYTVNGSILFSPLESNVWAFANEHPIMQMKIEAITETVHNL